jgi:hypothetical protein
MAKGDHIKVRRAGGLYTHHGIDLGDGTVVHFSGEPLRLAEACIERISLEGFLQNGVMRVVRHRGAVRPSDEVVAAALSMVGNKNYDLLVNNCEHFATFCKTGKARSGQIHRMAKTAAVVVAAGAGLAVYVVSRRLKKTVIG